MQQTLMITTVVFVVSVLVGMDKPVSAQFIDKYQLADHPNSQQANLTEKHGQVSKGTAPHKKTKTSSLGKPYDKARGLPSGNGTSIAPKPTTVISSRQSLSRTFITNGSCIIAPYKMTIRHAVSSTVTCSRRYEVKMCLGYCKSYTVPHGRQARVKCFCCKGKTVLVNVPLNCDGHRVIKQVPTVEKCQCRPCSEA